MEDDQQCERTQRRKGLKRKLDEEDSPSSSFGVGPPADLVVAMEVEEEQGEEEEEEEEEEEGEEEEEDEEMAGQEREIRCGRSHQAIWREVRAQVEVLERSFSWRGADRAAAKTASHILAELAKNEEVVNMIVDAGAVPALVKHLGEPSSLTIEGSGDRGERPCEHEVEKESAFALGLLAVKPEHQQLIVDAGALPLLVDLLLRNRKSGNCRAVNSVIRRAADAITNLAHENSNIKTAVRMEGGILPLVELLESADLKVQRAVAGALRTLAFKNDENKTLYPEMKKLFSENCHHCSLQSLVIYSCTITILLLFSHGLANMDDNDTQRTKACSPCSTAYLAADPNYHNLSSNRSAATEPCENLLGIVKVIKIPNLHRSLEGEGSHRRLISKLKVEVDSDFSSTYLDRFHCELVIIQSLNGVFADPFELQRLVNRKVYLDATVFGDANLELPSALSNGSFVEIHVDLVLSSKDNHELVIELPLHVRYPPLNGSGYSKVEISQADLYTRCRKKDIDKTCQWRVTALEVGPTVTVTWLIPCGDEAHTTVVSAVTFLSALVCALSIVSVSIFYRPTI